MPIPLKYQLISCAALLLSGCALRPTAPEVQPYSPMLTHSPTTTLDAQRRQADLFLAASPKRGAPRRAAKPPRSRPSSAPSPSATPDAAYSEENAPRAATPSLSIVRADVVEVAPTSKNSSALQRHLERHAPSLLAKDAGVDLPSLYKRCKSKKRIDFKKLKANDVVFFHNTRDANDDGRNNDWYTYVAIVTEAPDATGVATLRDLEQAGTSFSLNLTYPDMPRAESGVTLNTPIRAPQKDDLPYTRYLAGELFAGACHMD